jgi:hypothetical protein
MRSFWIAFAATAVPISALGVASFVVGEPPALMVGAIAVCYLFALGIAIGMAVVRRRRVAAGIFTGLAAGVLVLATTCFATIFTNRI